MFFNLINDLDDEEVDWVCLYECYVVFFLFELNKYLCMYIVSIF